MNYKKNFRIQIYDKVNSIVLVMFNKYNNFLLS